MTPAQYNEYERQAQVIERHEKWKEQQKQLITEIMDLDAKDGLYEDEVDKLAYEKYPVNMGEEWTEEGLAYEIDFNYGFRNGFIDGYRKAKETLYETLYTEEQVREAIKYALDEAKEAAEDLQEIWSGQIVLWIDTYHNIVSDKFIQSLKQPKKD